MCDLLDEAGPGLELSEAPHHPLDLVFAGGQASLGEGPPKLAVSRSPSGRYLPARERAIASLRACANQSSSVPRGAPIASSRLPAAPSVKQVPAMSKTVVRRMVRTCWKYRPDRWRPA